MAKPIICYNNLIVASIITDPGTAAGYSIADIVDLKAHSVWKSSVTTSPINIDIDRGGSPANANYLAMINHNLVGVGSGITVTVMAGATFPPATTVQAAFLPDEGTITLKTFSAPGALRYWRVILADSTAPFSAAPYIGELMLGMKTELPEFCAPTMDPFFTDAEVRGSRSEGGHFLGATMRGLTHRGTIEFGAAGIARSFFTSDLNTFISTHARLHKPFIFALDTADSDFDTPYYLRVPDTAKIPRLAVGGSYERFTLELPVEEAYMEPAS